MISKQTILALWFLDVDQDVSRGSWKQKTFELGAKYPGSCLKKNPFWDFTVNILEANNEI